jgi:hypothetical protein
LLLNTLRGLKTCVSDRDPEIGAVPKVPKMPIVPKVKGSKNQAQKQVQCLGGAAFVNDILADPCNELKLFEAIPAEC